MKRRDLFGVAVGSCLALGSGRSFAQGAASTSQAALLAEAGKERPLVIYSGFDNAIWRPVTEAFSRRYPGIKVQTLNIDTGEMAQRYFAEKRSGAALASLVVNDLDAIDRYYFDQKEILDYVSPEAVGLTGWGNPHPGVFAMSIDTVVMVWNRLALDDKQAPRTIGSLVDLVKANPGRFRGKLTTYAPDKDRLSYGIFMSLADVVGEDAMWKDYEVLGPATRFEATTGSMVQKLLTGEYLVGYNVGSAPLWASLSDPAFEQILGWSFITDGTPAVPRYAWIPVAAPSPNSAKLFLDFLLSREGQLAISRGGRTVNRPDIQQSELPRGEHSLSGITAEIGEKNLLIITDAIRAPENYDRNMARLKKLYGY